MHIDDDHFHDECGVFGVFGAEEAANLTYLGLHALQHRGQESAGIVSTDGSRLYAHRALGLVQEVFDAATIERLRGDRAIGHVRYSTAGESDLKNAQPIAVDYAHGSIALGHNGNLTNAEELRARLESEGSIFATTSDTEVLVHLIARSKGATTVERVAEALAQVRGAYSMVFLTNEELIAARDPHGFRPLCLGTMKEAHLVASEPPAFDLMGGSWQRDIEPGEMVVINKFGTNSLKPFPAADPKMCIFEYVYFARPDAVLGGVSVYEARKRLGRKLAEETPTDCDVVIPVPDSGVAGALGFAEAVRRPFELGLIRSHYVGRTFIEPQQSIRHFGVRLKLHPVRHILEGKRVAVIDDSIVRGTTSRKIVRMLRDAGAKEVHLRISVASDSLAVFLRHRHAVARRAHRCLAHRRRDRALPRRRLARLHLRSKGSTLRSAAAATATRASAGATRSRSKRATGARSASSSCSASDSGVGEERRRERRDEPRAKRVVDGEVLAHLELERAATVPSRVLNGREREPVLAGVRLVQRDLEPGVRERVVRAARQLLFGVEEDSDLEVPRLSLVDRRERVDREDDAGARLHDRRIHRVVVGPIELLDPARAIGVVGRAVHRHLATFRARAEELRMAGRPVRVDEEAREPSQHCARVPGRREVAREIRGAEIACPVRAAEPRVLVEPMPRRGYVLRRVLTREEQRGIPSARDEGLVSRFDPCSQARSENSRERVGSRVTTARLPQTVDFAPPGPVSSTDATPRLRDPASVALVRRRG